MYANELLDAYKNAKNYVQDKQIAHDLHLTPQKISNIRKGIRYISDSEAVFLAENAGIDPEVALLGCHADRNENPNIKAIWESMVKKYNGLGISRISMALGGLMLAAYTSLEQLLHYALCPVMLNKVSYNLHIDPLNYKGFYNALSEHEQELHFPQIHMRT